MLTAYTVVGGNLALMVLSPLPNARNLVPRPALRPNLLLCECFLFNKHDSSPEGVGFIVG